MEGVNAQGETSKPRLQYVRNFPPLAPCWQLRRCGNRKSVRLPTSMPDGLLLLSLLVLFTSGTSGSTRSASPDGGPPPPLSPPSLSPALPPAPGAATAVVTLVNEPGEEAGAIALGASLAMAGSVARRVVLVRGGLGAAIRPVLLHAFWDEVEETEGVRCSAAAAAHAGDGGGAHDHDHGCTVLALFSLTRYERLLYVDASTLALPRLDFDALLWSGLGLGLGSGSGSGLGLGLGIGLGLGLAHLRPLCLLCLPPACDHAPPVRLEPRALDQEQRVPPLLRRVAVLEALEVPLHRDGRALARLG